MPSIELSLIGPTTRLAPDENVGKRVERQRPPCRGHHIVGLLGIRASCRVVEARVDAVEQRVELRVAHAEVVLSRLLVRGPGMFCEQKPVHRPGVRP